jgi:hypothetical protein
MPLTYLLTEEKHPATRAEGEFVWILEQLAAEALMATIEIGGTVRVEDGLPEGKDVVRGSLEELIGTVWLASVIYFMLIGRRTLAADIP